MSAVRALDLSVESMVIRPPFSSEQVVQLLLSRLIGQSREVDLGLVAQTARSVARYADTTCFADGRPSPAPFPGLARQPCRTAASTMRLFAVDRDQIVRLWTRSQRLNGTFAILPPDLLAEFFSPGVLGAFAALLRDGPVVAGERAYESTMALADTTVPTRGMRPEGAPSRWHLQSHFDRLRRVMTNLVWLHGALRPGPESPLALWTWTPPKRSIDVGRPASVRPTPSLQIVRAAWHMRVERLERRIGAPLDELASLVPSLSRTQVAEIGIRELQGLTIIMLFFLTGGRAGAMARLRRHDYDPQFVSADGEVVAALRLDPRKGLPWWNFRPKILTPEASKILEGWLAFSDRWYGGLGADAAVLPSPKDASKHMDGHSFWPMFQGRATASRHKHGRTRPLIPADPTVTLDVRTRDLSDVQLIGFNAHAMRRFAGSVCTVAAKEWLAENPHPADPSDFSRALLDHRIPDDEYGYRGLSSEEGRQRLARVAIAGIWRLVTTTDGARKAVDEAALRKAVRVRTAVEQQLREYDAQITEADQRLQALGLDRPGFKPDTSVLAHALSQQLHANGIRDKERRLRDELVRLETEIDALSNDPRRRVPVPDDFDGPLPTADDVLLEELGVRVVAGARLVRKRNWLTTAEFADWYEVSAPTVRRWLRGEGLPFPAGDPRNVWPPNAVPVDDTLGSRKRRILVDRVSPAALRAGLAERLERLLATEPAGFDLSKDGFVR